MNDETNRIVELGINPNGNATPSRMTLGETGCEATLDDQGIIHIMSPENQQLFALRSDQIPFAKTQLLIVFNVWTMAWHSGRDSMQREFRDKMGAVLKLCL